MTEHSEQPSTSSLGNNLFAIGGLIIVLCFAAPLLIIIAIAMGATLFIDDNTTK
jgi:hypothetical protein